jgi:hypothetical protein
MKNSFILSVVLGGLILLGWPAFSLADWGAGHYAGHHGAHHYYRYHDHPYFGLHVAAFYPNEYFPVWVGGARYYYDDGVYYNYAGGSYVVVAPPIGAVVSTVPSDFQPTVINGVTYYTNNGTYYLSTPDGYKVVSAPVQTMPAPAQNVFMVNVPRNGGGYVSITIRRAGNGFLGPQGEFYPQFPNVSQLRTMYGR